MHYGSFIAKVVTLLATLAYCQTLPAQPSGRSGFNEGWEFTLEGETPRVVDLPHDWGVEKEFDLSLPSATGKLPWWGRAVYRKTLPVTPEDLEGRVFLDIDGAMAFASVRCNGKDLGGWPYGYASWRVELTPELQVGDNELEVLIDNKEESSRWYPGGGLYRNVWITRSPKTGIAHWGTSVTVDVSAADTARVWLRTTLSAAEHPCPGSLETSIYRAGRLVASSFERIGAICDSLEVLQAFVIPAPDLWSPEQPALYEAVTTVRTAFGEDAVKTRFGIRDARFTPDGFFLNGEKTPIKGVCLHHDAGALGAAWNDDAWTRRLEMLKRMGCNAIRSSHNPPAPELLDLCDSLGFLVMDELSDMWSVPKKPNGYSSIFDDWSGKDLAAMIRRDRNHPSVILWSIGNEVLEQLYPEKWYIADTLTAICHRLDPTRPTILCCDKLESSTRPWHEKADVYGFNYKPHAYASFHQANPGQPYMGSETASCVSTRGVYVFPVSEDKADGRIGFQVSSYDYCAPRWASSPEYEWKYEDAEPSVCGEFVWTGYDYLGEPTPFNSDMTELINFHDPVERAAAEAQLKANGRITPPSRSSYFGIIDLAGFPKDRYYAYQARWNPDLPMAHILPHWTWPGREGEITPVHVYTSGDSAELFVNGRSQGVRRKDGGYRLRWDDVVYQEGSLKVVAYKDGRRWATDVVRTAGKARKVRLKKDYVGRDLLFVSAVITDRRGEMVPDASCLLTFSVKGAGEIVATDSGDPTSLQGFRHDSIQAFHGLSSVIVRRTGKGRIRVRVTSDGLSGSQIRL